MAATDQLLQHLTEIEETAEEILADKQQLIELDKKRQKTREASRILGKDKKAKKIWVCFGNMFLKLPKPKTQKLLDNDFESLDSEISDIRKNLKPKVGKLRDLEGQGDLKGFDLNPLTKEELEAVEGVY